MATQHLLGRLLACALSLNAAPAVFASESSPRSQAQLAEQYIAAGNTAFAIDLYHQLLREQVEGEASGNLFFSPASISGAFALAYAGARGETRSQIARVLHFAENDSVLHPAMGSVLGRFSFEDEGNVLSTNNSIWFEKITVVEPAYLSLMNNHYTDVIQRVDYRNDPSGALEVMNSWVEDNTAGKIKDLLSEEEITDETRATLINTVYLNARWWWPFDKRRTNAEKFNSVVGNDLVVPTMRREEHGTYAKTKDFRVTSVGIQGSGLSLILLLPRRKNGLEKAERTLTPQMIESAFSELSTSDRYIVDLKMPKWRMDQRIKLRGTLRSMGVVRAFECNAEFEGMIVPRKQPEHYITTRLQDVIHQTFIEIDEQGLEAAAATGISMIRVSSGPRVRPKKIKFYADHPFLYIIRHAETGMILFMGRMVNPTAATHSTGSDSQLTECY